MLYYMHINLEELGPVFKLLGLEPFLILAFQPVVWLHFFAFWSLEKVKSFGKKERTLNTHEVLQQGGVDRAMFSSEHTEYILYAVQLVEPT